MVILVLFGFFYGINVYSSLMCRIYFSNFIPIRNDSSKTFLFCNLRHFLCFINFFAIINTFLEDVLIVYVSYVYKIRFHVEEKLLFHPPIPLLSIIKK